MNFQTGSKLREGILTVTGTAASTAMDEEISYFITVNTVKGEELLSYYEDEPVSNDKLATFDLSGLRNGVYDVVLWVVGESEIAGDSVRFVLDSNLKVGQFTFSEQDAVIPGRGMPLTVVRTYDSFNRSVGDFGKAWTLALNNMDVELDEERESVLDITDDDGDTGGYFSMRNGGGRNVTLTLPDGQRATFLFTLVRKQGDEFGFEYVPKFIAPDGVNAKLEVVPEPTLNVILGGIFPPYWHGGDPRLPEYGFDFRGFKLTAEDGTEYSITREDKGVHDVSQEPDKDLGTFPNFGVQTWGPPKLTEIKHPDGSFTYFSKDKVWEQHKVGTDWVVTRAIAFETNSVGRIVGIYDPSVLNPDGSIPRDGTTRLPTVEPLVKYLYDSDGRLKSVKQLVDRDHVDVNQRHELVSSYSYHPDGEFSHYITAVSDGRGVPMTRNEYYPPGSRDAGRLMSVTAPDGSRTVFERVYPTMEVGGSPNPEFALRNHGDAAVVAIEKILSHPKFGNFNGPDGGIVTVHCADAKGNVLYSTDHLGNTVQRTYDSHSNVSEERRRIDGGNQDMITRYERGYKWNGAKETDEIEWEIVTAPKSAAGELIKTKTTYEKGLPKKSYDGRNLPGEAFYTENFYDANTRQLLRTEARRTGQVAPITVISESVYYPESGVDPANTPFKGLLKYTKNAAGTRTRHFYYDSTEPARGRFGDLKRVQVIKQDGTTVIRDVSYEYDVNGKQTIEFKRRDATDNANDGRGSIVTIKRYDDRGRLKEIEDSESQPGRPRIASTYYNIYGKLDRTENCYGNSTTNTYGPNGDVIKTSYPDGSIARRLTRTIRDESAGPIKRRKEVIAEEPHFPFGHPRYNASETIRGTRSISDEIGRQIRSERLADLNISWDPVSVADLPRNSGLVIYKTTFIDANVLSWTETKYNASGQVESTEQGYMDGGPQVVPSVSTSFYDGNGRRHRVQTHLRNQSGDGDDEYTQTFYLFDKNGNQTHFCTLPGQIVTPPAPADGRWTRYEYDDFNRRTKTYFPFLTGQNEATRDFSRTKYDLLGQRIEDIDKTGVSTGFGHDDLGHLIAVTNAYRVYTDETTFTASADQTITRYEYDWVGNMTAQFDANQEPLAEGIRVATRFGYDNLGRRTSRTLPGTTAQNPTVPLVERVRYDFAAVNGKPLQQTERTDFNGTIVTMNYDKMGRLSEKTPTGGTALPVGGDSPVSFTYDANGRRLTMTDASGNTGYGYDDHGRLETRTKNIGSWSGNPRVFLSELNCTQTYHYTGVGNLQRVRLAHSGAPDYDKTYGWDELNRLKTVYPTGTPANGTEYTYDNFGNLETVSYPTTTRTITRYRYDQQHRLTDLYVGVTANQASLAHFDYNTDTPLGKAGTRFSAIETVGGATRTARWRYDHLYLLRTFLTSYFSPNWGRRDFGRMAGMGS